MLLVAAAPLRAQLIAVPPPSGLDGETVVAAPPGGSVLLYRVGLVGLINKARLTKIELDIGSLAAPLSAGLAASDFSQLRLIESTNPVLGDGDDVLLNTVPWTAIDVSGTTDIDDDGNATPLGLFPFPIGELFKFYFVVADLAPTAMTGHAFRVGAAFGHITTSLPSTIGLPVTAVNGDRVVINNLLADPGVDPLTMTFGTVDVDSTGTRTLTITNDGAAVLVVTGMASDDAQFTPDATPPFTVAAGDDRDIGIDFVPAAAGLQSANLTVTHDAAGSPVTVNLSGTGVPAAPDAPELEVAPANLDFGAVALGATLARSFTVSNPGSATLHVSDVHISNGQFSAVPDAFDVLAGEDEVVWVTYAPTTTGAANAVLTFTDDGAGPADTVTLAGTGLNPGLFVSHTAVNFGNIDFDRVGAFTLGLTNVSGSAIDVTDIASDDGQFDANLAAMSLDPGESRNIELRFSAASLGTKHATLSISHNGAVDPIQLPMVADATVTLDNSSMEFGAIDPGDTALLSVTIANPSGAPVTITHIASDNPLFVPDLSTFVIPAGGSQQIAVAFTPIDINRAVAHLSITHNPTITVTLIGNDRPWSQSGRDAAGKPLPEIAVPFGGELLFALLLCGWALLRKP